MTSNLLQGRADASEYEALLERMAPDVVVTQELGHDCAAVLTDRYRNHHLHPADDFVGRGIATNLDAEFGHIEMPVRPGTSAKLQVNGHTWNLAGIHLVNPIDFPWWTSVRHRSEQLDAIKAWAADLESGPLLIAGDFNASPRWPAYREMVTNWSDLVAEHFDGPERTWGWRPGWRRLLRIDHVFGSGLTAQRVSVETIVGSDHSAVVVDVATESERT
jgi:endonuclease/exonuclease/phosphatase (EEP) superfamily protein YafD